jgi:4-hydroxy-tetrahydrodipicolinate synthase
MVQNIRGHHVTRSKFGLSCAVATPFQLSGSIDASKLVAHAQSCVAEGCDSITLFGTTGEGFSIGPAERGGVYQACRDGGFDMRRQVGSSVMAASVEEAAVQARQALDFGCRHILLAPPFYIKGVGDDGLFEWHAALFRALGADCRDIVLYNLPSQTAVTISHELVARLRKAFPSVIIGVKDSSGNWPYTERMLAEHRDIAILIGDERHLAKAIRLGGQGSICGMANAYAALLKPLVDVGEDSPVVNALVDAVVALPVLPSVKALVGQKRHDPSWWAVRAPLVPLSESQRSALLATCAAITV